MTTGRTAWTVLPAGSEASNGRIRRAVIGDIEIHFSTGKLAADRIGRLAGNARAPGTVRTAGQLGVVTQVGNSFQLEHPEVPILLDRGRHLIIDLDDLSAQTDPQDHTCWRSEPLADGAVLVRSVKTTRASAQRGVQLLVDQLSGAAVQADLQTLVGFSTRHSLRPGFNAACAFATNRLTSLGYATAEFPISVNGSASKNLVADRIGAGVTDRGLVLITAHLDSINIAGGPNASAPGADDNGSGSAGLLELARVLAQGTWRQDLRLILFGGEEQGLFGSKQYVTALPPAERNRITAVLNMDMIGTRNTPDPRVLLEGSPLSQRLIDDLAAAAATYTGLTIEVSLNPFASDHVPFIQAGIPAVLTIEGADSANTHIHTASDVVAHIEQGFLVEILRMNLAAVAGWLGTLQVPRPAGSVVSHAPGTLDVFVVGPDSALYQRSFGPTGWQSGFTNLGGVIARP